MKKLIITKTDGKITDFNINGEIVDVDYFDHGEEVICAVVMKNMTIEDFFHLSISDIPQVTNIDILVKPLTSKREYEFEEYIVGNGIEKVGNEYFQKFYFDNITGGDDLYGKPGILFISVLEKVVNAKSNVKVFTSLEIDDVARLGFKVSSKLSDTIESQYKDILDLINSYCEETLKLLNDVDEAIISKSFKIKVPKEIRTAIKQYLIFFEEFVYKSKGYRIDLSIKKTEDGLQINISDSETTKIEKLREWMTEFVGLLYQNIENLTIEFEIPTTEFKADLLIADLKNQITSMKNSLDIARLENKYLDKEVDSLKFEIDRLNAKDFYITQSLINNSTKLLMSENFKNYTETEKELLDIICRNTDSELERKELIKSLETINKDSSSPEEVSKSKSLFRKFLDSGISESAKQFVRELIELGGNSM